MPITLELTPEQERLLEQKARQQGMSANAFATRLITSGLEPTSVVAEDDYFARRARQMREEREAMSPEEQTAEDADLLEFKRAMNANRRATGERLVFPDAE